MEEDRPARPRRRPASRPSLLALRGVGRVLALGAGAAARRPTPTQKTSQTIVQHPADWTVEEALTEVPALAANAAKAFFASTTSHSPAASLLGASVTGMLAAYWVLELAQALLWPVCFALLGLMVFAPGFAHWLLLDVLPSAMSRFCRAVTACRLAAEAAAAAAAEEVEGQMLVAAARTSKTVLPVENDAAPRGDGPTVLLPMDTFVLLADSIPLSDARSSVPETSCRQLSQNPSSLIHPVLPVMSQEEVLLSSKLSSSLNDVAFSEKSISDSGISHKKRDEVDRIPTPPRNSFNENPGNQSSKDCVTPVLSALFSTLPFLASTVSTDKVTFPTAPTS